MNIMVLGAGGYLGRKLCDYLQIQGHIVAKVMRNISDAEKSKKTKIIYASIEDIQKNFEQNTFDWVINCAVTYEKKETKQHEIVNTNLVFALQVLNCAIECGVKNFMTIDTGLPKELNLYSFTKKQFAEFGNFYSYKYNITFLNICLEMFYGADEPQDRFLTYCCNKMLKNEELLLTIGTQKRDIIHIDDVCVAINLLLNTELTGFHCIPLGSGQAVSIHELLEYMSEIMDSKSKLIFGAIPARENEPDCIANMDFLYSIGFNLKYPWKEGIKLFCREIKDIFL